MKICRNWKTMPSFMLKKVAIAQGFRLAFPDDLGGMPYIPEELPEGRTGHATSEALPAAPVEDVPEPDSAVGEAPVVVEGPTATTAQTAAIMEIAKRRKITPVEAITAALGYEKGISDISKAEASAVLTFHNKKVNN